MAAFDMNFPTQQVIEGYVLKHVFDKDKFISPKLGFGIDDSSVNSPTMVEWDVLEPVSGMTNLSALDAEPVVINNRVRKTVAYAPLFFKEQILIGESKLINARKLGSQNERAGADLVFDALDTINLRIDTLVEYSCLQTLLGKFKWNGRVKADYGFAADQLPDVSTTAGYGGNYWDSNSSGHECQPLQDIAKASEALRYKGVYGISLVMDIKVMQKLCNAVSVRDLLKQSTYAVYLGTEQLQQFLPGMVGCGIDEVIVSDQGYLGDDGNGVPFVPDKYCFLVGKTRDGKLGDFKSTPNVYNGYENGQAKAGRFVILNNEYMSTQGAVPRITVTGGIYGLPVLYRPDLVVAMKVLS